MACDSGRVDTAVDPASAPVRRRSLPARLVLVALLAVLLVGASFALFRLIGVKGARDLVCTACPFPNRVRLTHVWSISVDSSERVWVGTCDETQDEEAVAWFCSLDTSSLAIEPIAPATTFATDPIPSLPQAKIHPRLLQGYDGRIYRATHTTRDALPEEYAGGHLFAFSPDSRSFEDLGIIVPHEGIIALAISPNRRTLYGVTYPSEQLFGYDIATRSFEIYGRTSKEQPTRSLEVMGDGTVVVGGSDLNTGQGTIWVYLPRERRLVPAEVTVQERRPTATPISKTDYAKWVHRYWLASVLNPAGNALYTTGYHSGHICRIVSDGKTGVTVEDLGRTVDWYENYVEPGPFAHSISRWREWVFFFIDNSGTHHPDRIAGAHLVAQNTLTHDRIDLGRLVSATAEPLAVVTAAASSERSNRIYFAANTSASNRAALYVLDCLSLGLAGQ